MGILAEPAKLIVSLPLPPRFTVCELGDQYLTHVSPHRLAKHWYLQDLKASRYESIDANGRGTITFNLNSVVDPSAVGTFDLVTDFGTGEHIFDQANLWTSIHRLTKVGGYIVFDRPSSGYPGHGFYLTDPSLFQDVASANDYEIVHLQTRKSKRGEITYGALKKTKGGLFTLPYQGRYKSSRKA